MYPNYKTFMISYFEKKNDDLLLLIIMVNLEIKMYFTLI